MYVHLHTRCLHDEGKLTDGQVYYFYSYGTAAWLGMFTISFLTCPLLTMTQPHKPRPSSRLRR
jgi:hypothetical protein